MKTLDHTRFEMNKIDTKELLLRIFIPTIVLCLSYLVLGHFCNIPYILLFCVLGTFTLFCILRVSPAHQKHFLKNIYHTLFYLPTESFLIPLVLI